MINRKLSSAETSWSISNEIAPINGVTFIKVKGPLTAELVREAIDVLQARHPLAQVRQVKKGGRFRFETPSKIPPIPLAIHEIATAADHNKIVEFELDQPFDCENGPMMRCCFTRIVDEPGHYYFIMNYLHTIGDGSSVMNYFKEFLLYCNAKVTNDTDFLLEPLPPKPPSAHYFPKRIFSLKGRLGTVRYMMKQLYEEFWLGHKRLFTDSSKTDFSSLKTGFMQVEIPEKVMRSIIKAAGKQSTSLHGAVCASVLMAQYEYYLQSAGTEANAIPLKCISFANARPFLEPKLSSEHYGCYVSLLSSLHQVGGERPFWDLAQEINEVVKRQKNTDEIYHASVASKILVKTAIVLKRTKLAALIISNVGRVRYNEDFGQFEIKEYVGYVSNVGVSCNMALVLSRFAGNLRWNYMFPKPYLSQAAAEKIALRANEILLSQSGFTPAQIANINANALPEKKHKTMLKN